MSEPLCPQSITHTTPERLPLFVIDLVEAVRALPYGRPSDRTVDPVVREPFITALAFSERPG